MSKQTRQNNKILDKYKNVKELKYTADERALLDKFAGMALQAIISGISNLAEDDQRSLGEILCVGFGSQGDLSGDEGKLTWAEIFAWESYTIAHAMIKQREVENV